MADPTTDPTDLADTSPTRLILIRHGESQVTVGQIVGGPKACTGLSDLGRQQAQRLRDRFAAGHEPAIDDLWSSTMPRAVETAQIINETLVLEHHQEKELEEWRPGDADGMTWDEARATWPAADGLSGNPFVAWAPGAESRQDFHLRAGQALDAFLRDHEGRSVILVCHGGVIDVAFRLLTRQRTAGDFHLWTLNTSLTEFIRKPGDDGLWQLSRYNDTAHLAGLPDAT